MIITLKIVVRKKWHLDCAQRLGNLCMCFEVIFKIPRVLIIIIVILFGHSIISKHFDNGVENIGLHRVSFWLCAGIRKHMHGLQDILQETIFLLPSLLFYSTPKCDKLFI